MAEKWGIRAQKVYTSAIVVTVGTGKIYQTLYQLAFLSGMVKKLT
jgi:hypothetical protein